jgi:two-component sensor histidine kinase
MLNEHQPVIVNAIAHVAGAIVFGIFLVLALRGSPGRRPRQSLLSIASALLALLWNVGSLASLTMTAGGIRWTAEAVSFCSLSLLPAVLLHVSLNNRFRNLAAAGYLLSATATAMHLSESVWPTLHLHKLALWVITFGFGALTVVYAMSVLRDGKEARGRTSQLLASMFLMLFAVTFSHFGAGHPPEAWKELLVHHAGIPIALLILLQDYRFVFMDAFVRFLANVILAALLSYAGIRIAAGLIPESGTAAPFADLVGVAGLCVLLVLFAYLRGVLQRLLTRAVFRRGGIESAAQDIRSKGAEIHDEAQYLSWASERVAAMAEATRFEIISSDAVQLRSGHRLGDLDQPFLADDDPSLLRGPRWNWAEAIVPIRLSHGDLRYLFLGRRRGGRRYLSEDLRALIYVAGIIAEEVERSRATEVQRLVAEAELRALHSQINPHFLFNALNTIYGIIPREAAGARRTVLSLAEIFRYFLQSDKRLIPLAEELKIVTAYLEIERLRLGPRLQTEIHIDEGADRVLVPVLSVQPLVENAIKHGVSTRPDQGRLRLSAKMGDSALTITVEDSGAGTEAGPGGHPSAGLGLGLANVSRRLQLCFGPRADVTMQQGVFGTSVHFSVPVAAVLEQQCQVGK